MRRQHPRATTRTAPVALTAVTVLAAVLLTGCGDRTGDPDGDPDGGPLVVTGKRPAAPYDGPLRAPDDKRGAAWPALECDGAADFGSAESDPWSEGDGGKTPEEGLRAYFDMAQPELPEAGYRVEREADGRVLFSLDVKGRTRVAVVVAEDQPRRPGWGPESTAACDPAEFPRDFTEARGYEVWTDRDGDPVPRSRVSSSPGSEHCDWQRAHFLETGRGADRKLYARDPDTVLPPEMLTGRYDGDTSLPKDARATGYRLAERTWKLWLAPDGGTAYLRTPDGVEAWPKVKDGTGCA